MIRATCIEVLTPRKEHVEGADSEDVGWLSRQRIFRDCWLNFDARKKTWECEGEKWSLKVRTSRIATKIRERKKGKIKKKRRIVILI